MSCIFCDIVKGCVPCKIVAQNEHAIAFLDVNPMSDGHTIVIPKKHYKAWSEVPQLELSFVTSLVKDVAEIITISKLKPWGFNYLSNEGNIAGQEVMHFHIHVIPKYGKNEGFKIAMGTRFIDDIDFVHEKILKAIEKR